MRPPAFTYKRGELHAENIPAHKLIEKYGTPLYVYSATAVKDRFKAYQKAFSKQPHTICYSVKANSNLSLLKMLSKLGSGFDVVSGGELARVMTADKKATKRVVFSGVGKTAEELAFALDAGILIFNCESASELRLLAEVARAKRKVARVAMRVNPEVFAETHPYITTGMREHKFGVPIEDALNFYAIAADEPFLEIAGVSVHIGSQITDVRPFAEAMQRVMDLVAALREAGHDIRYVDAGGGLGIQYQGAVGDDFKQRIDEYAAALKPVLANQKLHLLLEPGRSIIGPSGMLLTEVIYLKNNGLKRFAIVDGAMNDLIRPSLYNAYHEIVPVRAPSHTAAKHAIRQAADGRHDAFSLETYDIVGPICETGDFFARGRELPTLREGDMLALLDAGAYGMSLASNYNSRPRPAEILVEGSKAKVIRKRESFDDLIRNES